MTLQINGHPILTKSHSYIVDIVRYSAGAPITFTVLSPTKEAMSDQDLRLFWARLHLPVSNASIEEEDVGKSSYAIAI